MMKALLTRLQQGHRTMKFPAGPAPVMPERFRGLPVMDAAKCGADCHARCAAACPTGAIICGEGVSPHSLAIDLGRCLFCGECAAACPQGAIAFTREHRLAARTRKELTTSGSAPRVEALANELRKVLGRALRLRQVSAGGCNACEADTNVLGTVGWDLSRFGIQFVASPRHADGLLITGCVPENMRLALEKTYQAVPSPKIVIAVGACAISGGPYIDHPEIHNGADSIVPVDLYVPGCPPHPLTILEGLLDLLGKQKRQ